MSLCMRKPTIWVLTRSDTNQPVQSQEQARCLKFGLKKNGTIRAAKTKALISFAVATKLICGFVFTQAFCWFRSGFMCYCQILSHMILYIKFCIYNCLVCFFHKKCLNECNYDCKCLRNAVDVNGNDCKSTSMMSIYSNTCSIYRSDHNSSLSRSSSTTSLKSMSSSTSN